MTITFAQVKDPGAAPVSFSAGSVLANDGKRTNILDGMQGGAFTLAQAPPGSVSIPKTGTVSHPAITTTPQINDGQWYSIDSVTFGWALPSNVTAVSYAISDNPDYQLSPSPLPLASKATYDLTTFADRNLVLLLKLRAEWGMERRLRKVPAT